MWRLFFEHQFIGGNMNPFIIHFSLVIILLFIPIPAKSIDHNAALFKNDPVYVSKQKNQTVRRREYGNVDGSNRGFPRGAGSGSLTGGFTRGFPRGKNQGFIDTPQTLPDRMAPLAPQTTGYTSNPQPRFYYYISGPWKGKLEFMLNDPDEIEPVVSVNIDGPQSKGIFCVDLKNYNYFLKPGKEYEWFIAIVLNQKDRSGDIFISATIQYQKSDTVLNKRLGTASITTHQYAFSENGYWYDSISHLSYLIKSYPKETIYPKQRSSLLRQVKLFQAASCME